MIKSQMDRQLGVLKELDDLITRSDSERKTGTASTEDVDHLRGYVADMRRACNAAIALETALTPPKEEKKEEAPAAEAKPAKRKSRAKKAEPKPEITPEETAPQETPEGAETEDLDLSFLD